MANADTLIVSGPHFQQASVGASMVTPTGGTQAALADMLGGVAAVGGAYGLLKTVATGLTAHAGGGQSAALLLTAAVNRITTVASALDSVKLPPSVAGMSIVVINDAATNATQVFGSGTDTIDGIATATGVTLSAAKRAMFICFAAGTWVSLTGVKAT